MMIKDSSMGLITKRQMQEIIEQNLEFFQQSLQKTIKGLLQLYPQKQEHTSKGELKYIYISLLLTSIPFKLPLYRVDFCDQQGEFDLIEHAAYFDLSPVSDVIYTDVFFRPHVIQRLSGRENYVNEQNWFQNANVLHEAMIVYLDEILEPIKKELFESGGIEIIFEQL